VADADENETDEIETQPTCPLCHNLLIDRGIDWWCPVDDLAFER
jgi:hypothetical protein